MGVLDGFNPCAMWVLLFLISLLLGMENKKRMWILGSAFIVASASVYFLFMSAWLNLILFLGFVSWVKILIGFFALLGGIYSIKEFVFNKDSGCKVTGDETRQKIFEKSELIGPPLRGIFTQYMLLWGWRAISNHLATTRSLPPLASK